MPEPAGVRRHYIPTLDGWRAISIAAVILFHLPALFVGRYSLRPLQNWGGYGVAVFFVISGLLISTRMLIEEKETGSISLRSFYCRRLFRIQPAALLYLLSLVALWAVSTIPFRFVPWIMSLLACRNYYPETMWDLPGATYTSHFWSLAVEEHFYLLLPLLLIVLRRPSSRVVGLGALSFASFAWARVGAHFHMQVAHSDVSFERLMIPTFLAVTLFHYPQLRKLLRGRLVLLLACGLAALVVISVVRFHGAATGPLLVFLLTTLVFGTTLYPSFILSRALEVAPIRFLGKISYSLYLWQQLFCIQPNLSYARGLLLRMQDARISWFCALLAAICSYYLIEKPFIRLGHRVAARARRPEMEPAGRA